LRTTLVFLMAIGINALIIFLALNDDDDEEGIWTDQVSFECDEYCENSHQCGHEMKDRPTVQQPVNAWTNLAYLLVGLWPISNRLNTANVVFCLVNVYLCIGSFTFHASLSETWRTIDIAAMYTQLATVLGHGFHAVTNVAWGHILVPVLMLAVSMPFVKGDMDDASLNSSKVVVILVSLITYNAVVIVAYKILQICRCKRGPSEEEMWRYYANRAGAIWGTVTMAAMPGVVFMAAVVVNDKDMDRTWCNPDGAFQGHGLWHILTGLAALILWEFFSRNKLVDLKASRIEYNASIGQGDNDEDNVTENNRHNNCDGVQVYSDEETGDITPVKSDNDTDDDNSSGSSNDGSGLEDPDHGFLVSLSLSDDEEATREQATSPRSSTATGPRYCSTNDVVRMMMNPVSYYYKNQQHSMPGQGGAAPTTRVPPLRRLSTISSSGSLSSAASATTSDVSSVTMASFRTAPPQYYSTSIPPRFQRHQSSVGSSSPTKSSSNNIEGNRARSQST